MDYGTINIIGIYLKVNNLTDSINGTVGRKSFYNIGGLIGTKIVATSVDQDEKY
jgi:hypothetical protein